jgi:competence protein ComEA
MLKLTPREQKLLLLVGILIVVGFVLRFYLPAPCQKAELLFKDNPGESAGVEFISQGELGGENELIVHVVGGVPNPGVYRLPPGSRVFEAIEMAGGALEEELLAGINLAQPLYDGQQVVVPNGIDGEAGAITFQSGGSSSLLNINRASREELESLPGIGPVKAREIVEFREKNGPFRSISDLTQVKGIGAKILEGLEGYITIY